MIRGLIFDFDGLMVDTEVPARDSWIELYQEYSCEFPLAIWSATLGGSGRDFDPCAYLAELSGQSLDHEMLRARRRRRNLALAEDQPLLPGVAGYLAASKRLALKLAVASSSSRAWVAGHLNRLGVLGEFDAIVTADDVERVKPDPEIYLTALARLGLAPDEAIAFEDAPNGIRAARHAGIFTVVVPNEITSALALDHANLRLASLADTPLEALLTTIAPQAATLSAQQRNH